MRRDPDSSRTDPSRRRAGAILILSMWVLFFLAALVLVFARSVRTDLLAAANLASAVEAAAVERGAEQYAIALVDQEKDSVLALSESYFAGIPVGGGCFWILRPDHGDDSLPVLGLVDEASKVNLNSATADMLLSLPGMTADLAASIVDWRDADGEATAGGAEDDYYLALPQPYRPKNAPLETVEELLLIKGSSPELLYGTGAGSRYGADPAGGTAALASVRSDLELSRGIYDDLTVYSGEPAAAAGAQEVNVNDDDPARLSELLRQTLTASRAEEVAERARPRPPFRDPFDFAVRAGLTAAEFDALAGRITTGARPSSTGRINIDTAPREVLLCLPGLTDADVASLLSRRPSSTGSAAATASSTDSAASSGLGWVVEALGAKSVGLWSLITTRSYQYSADILAVSGNGKAFRRTRIVIDVRTSPPKVVHRRDLTQTGWPLDPAILSGLREGRGSPAAYASPGGIR